MGRFRFLENLLKQFSFGLLELKDFLLYGGSGNHLVNRNLLFLTDPVSPITCLSFSGGVPPRVEVQDHVGGSQIQSGSPALSEIKKTGMESSSWNRSTCAIRSLDEPSR